VGWRADTKYYPEALVKNKYGQEKINSSHLYQIFAYLKNCKARPVDGPPPEGILLYPTTSRDLDLSFVIGGHEVRVRTLQLDQPWQKIHAEHCELLSLPSSGNLEAVPLVA
jgi:5-methylcytosine-specific restriction enzyme subunit McrC